MRQNEKLDYMKEMVQRVAGEEGMQLEMKEFEVIKNGIRHDCLLIKEPNGDLAVSWQIEEDEHFDQPAKERLYLQAKAHVSAYKEMAKEIDPSASILIEWIGDWENVKDTILPVLADSERFRYHKAEVLHRPFLDMEIGYRIMGDYTQIPYLQNRSISVVNDMLDFWKQTEEVLYQTAMENLRRHIRFRDFASAFQEMCEGPAPNKEEFGNMIICSNDILYYGAAGMLLTEELQKIAKEKGVKELMLIPSSLHECIIGARGEEMVPFLLQLASEDNPFSVGEEDFLTGSVYIYDVELGYRILE